jgi:hypothetical protein
MSSPCYSGVSFSTIAVTITLGRHTKEAACFYEAAHAGPVYASEPRRKANTLVDASLDGPI